MTPTPRAALAMALAGGAALALPTGTAIAIFTAILIAISVDAWFARAAATPRRTLTTVAARAVGVPLTVEVDDRRRHNIRLRQPLVADIAIAENEQNGAISTMLTPMRRGQHHIPPAIARRTGPLGLARTQRRASRTEAAQLTVFPDVLAARRIAISVRRGKFRDAGVATKGALGLGTDFEAIRDYQPDDDVRQINWPATQRLQRPMSNQYRIEQDRDVICLVDTGRLMCAPVGERTRLDATVDAVAAVAAVTDEVGDRCGVIAFDHEIRRNISTRRRGADAVVRAIHDLEPRLVDSDFELAFRSVRNTKRALVIVLTDLLDERAAASLLAAAPVLARRHAVMVASVTDIDIEALAVHDIAAGPGGRSANRVRREVAWRRFAAQRVLDDRKKVVAQLEQRSVRVVEAPPTLLPEACVRAYLQLKSRARL